MKSLVLVFAALVISVGCLAFAPYDGPDGPNWGCDGTVYVGHGLMVPGNEYLAIGAVSPWSSNCVLPSLVYRMTVKHDGQLVNDSGLVTGCPPSKMILLYQTCPQYGTYVEIYFEWYCANCVRAGYDTLAFTL